MTSVLPGERRAIKPVKITGILSQLLLSSFPIAEYTLPTRRLVVVCPDNDQFLASKRNDCVYRDESLVRYHTVLFLVIYTIYKMRGNRIKGFCGTVLLIRFPQCLSLMLEYHLPTFSFWCKDKKMCRNNL